MADTLVALFWEFVQNLPLVTGFVVAIQLWQQSEWVIATVCMVVSSAAGSFIIHITEPKIVKGHREPVRVTIANIATIAAMMFACAVYLSAGWSSWKTDLIAGVLAGIVLGMVQDLTAKNPIGIGHCVAFACSGSVALIGIRVLVDALPVLMSILIITAVVTLIIGLIDYGPLASV